MMLCTPSNHNGSRTIGKSLTVHGDDLFLAVFDVAEVPFLDTPQERKIVGHAPNDRTVGPAGTGGQMRRIDGQADG